MPPAEATIYRGFLGSPPVDQYKALNEDAAIESANAGRSIERANVKVTRKPSSIWQFDARTPKRPTRISPV